MKVSTLTQEEMVWPMGAEPNPHYLVDDGGYKRQVKVDPFPCYAIPIVPVIELRDACVERFPLFASKQSLVILDREGVDRFNGVTFEGSIYWRDDGTKWEDEFQGAVTGKIEKFGGQTHTIVLAGKRVPHHPAFVRYLVAHEYGHAAFHEARRALGYRQHPDEEKLEDDYMRARLGRDHPRPKAYSGGTWHATPGEIIANDFRVVVMGIETDYWPHDVLHPLHELVVGPVREWWDRAREAVKAAADRLAPKAASS